ncbi:MAG: Acetylxylan esterase precursor [Verrucomicrobiota bacterium]|jgi:acetyl esterase/lipase
MKPRLIAILPLLLILLLGALSAAAQSPASTPAFTRTTDVVYARKLGVALTLDVFQPTRGANGYGIIYLVSGGWKSSHESISPATYAPFLARGYTVFAVVHGTQPKFVLAEIVPDIHRAVRFIRHHAARWAVDPDHLGVTGASAGGHLSITLGTQGGPGPASSRDPVDRVSSAVQAVACFFPPTDFLNYGREGEVAAGVGILKDYAGAFGPESATPEGRQKLGETFSPARFVSARMAPTLIIHGDADPLVPIQQAHLFAQRATAAGGNVRIMVKPGAAHGGKTWTNIEGDRAIMADWFDRHLCGLQPTTP